MPIVGVVVQVIVKEDRKEEFLDLIEKDAVGSRLEPGCLRFGALHCVIIMLLYYIILLLSKCHALQIAIYQ